MSRIGIATVVTLLASPLAPSQNTLIHDIVGDDVGDEFGFSVAGAGDVDNDGVPDFVVGADRDDNGFKDSGTVTVYSGATGGVLYTWDGSGQFARLGHAVGGAGDVNNDGYADIICSEIYQQVPSTSGQVYVYSGKDGTQLHHWFAGGSDFFGESVNGIGDIDGDGHDDVAVGATFDTVGGSNAGAVYLYSGQTGALIRSHHGNPGDYMGFDVVGGKDVDGDSVPDVAVGLPWFSGRVDVYSGANGNLLHTFNGFGQFGYHIDLSDDINNDGKAEIVVGDRDSTGHCWVFSGDDGSVLHEFNGISQPDAFGWAVAALGDASGDGVPDFAVGAYGDDDNGSASGSATVFSGVDGSQLMQLNGKSAGWLFGWSIAGVGDIDGDGLGDMVVGASPPHSQATVAGYVRVHSGICKGQISTYGVGLAGSGGFVPKLSGTGCPAPTGSFGIAIEDGLGGAGGLLMIGFTPTSLPFLGGTMLVLPPWIKVPIYLPGTGNGVGAVSITTVLPDDPNIVGLTMYMQALVYDPGAIQGNALSNGLAVEIR